MFFAMKPQKDGKTTKKYSTGKKLRPFYRYPFARTKNKCGEMLTPICLNFSVSFVEKIKKLKLFGRVGMSQRIVKANEQCVLGKIFGRLWRILTSIFHCVFIRPSEAVINGSHTPCGYMN